MNVDRIPAKDRATWLALRERDVTASVAGALLGVHEYQTAFGLWALKSGRTTEDPEESAPMRRGRLLEPVAVALLREQFPKWKVAHNTGRKTVYLRDEQARIGATPDVFVTCRHNGRGVVQIKTVEPRLFRQKWVQEGDVVEPPLWIAIQAIIEAVLDDADFAVVAALVIGYGVDLHVVDVPIHRGIYDRIKEETARFWQMVETGEMPDPDYTRDGETLAAIYAQDNGREIDLSEHDRARELVAQRQSLKASIKADAAALAPIEAELIAIIGPYERAHVPGWKVSRPLITRTDRIFGTKTEHRQLRISPAPTGE